MSRVMKIISIVTIISTIIFSYVYITINKDIYLTLAISFGTTAYHFIMRLIIGYIVNGILHNKVNYNNIYFKSKKFEQKIYKIIKVKKWKDKMPTYNPEFYSTEKHSLEEIAMVTCQAEIVHELIIIFSFVPVLFTLWFNSFWVFMITSIISALIDTLFVIMQRYNRPRIIKLINLKNRR